MIFVCSLWLVILLPIFIHGDDASSSHPSSTLANFVKQTYTTTSALDWVSDSILNVINSLIPNKQPSDGVEGNKKKKVFLTNTCFIFGKKGGDFFFLFHFYPQKHLSRYLLGAEVLL